jgi:hypothetical protein
MWIYDIYEKPDRGARMDHCLSLLSLASAREVFLTALSKRLRLGESLKGRERS